MSEVKNILIVKMSSIGDVVHSLPFLDLIKERFPRARIDWIVEEAALQVLSGHPAIDRLIVSRRKSWQKQLLTIAGLIPVGREAVRLYKELRSRDYDLIVDLQGLFRSGFLVGISKGKRKIGMSGAREGGGIFLNEPPVIVDYEQHAVDRYLQVAQYLGCDVSSWNGEIPVSQSDKEAIQRLINRNGFGKRPLVAINPVARWKTKMWDPQRLASLADRIGKELSCDIVFTGGGRDQTMIDTISGAMEEKPLNLAGKTSLKELACLYAMCTLLITADTGPMHIAASVGCRVVALFGPTDPLLTGPYGRGHEVVRAGVECSPCFKKKCESMICMTEITVGRCFETVKSILTQQREG